MDSSVSVYFSSVCLISKRQQLRTSTSACKDKRFCVWTQKKRKIKWKKNRFCFVPFRSERYRPFSRSWLIPAPAEVAAQPSSGPHISFHRSSRRPARRRRRTARPRLRGRSRCRTPTGTHKWILQQTALNSHDTFTVAIVPLGSQAGETQGGRKKHTFTLKKPHFRHFLEYFDLFDSLTAAHANVLTHITSLWTGRNLVQDQAHVCRAWCTYEKKC